MESSLNWIVENITSAGFDINFNSDDTIVTSSDCNRLETFPFLHRLVLLFLKNGLLEKRYPLSLNLNPRPENISIST